MKKIFAISLIAMTAVTAANAEIASKGYVDEQIGSTASWKLQNESTNPDVATAIARAIDGVTGGASSTYQTKIGGTDGQLVKSTGTEGQVGFVTIDTTKGGIENSGAPISSGAVYSSLGDYTKTADLGALATKDSVAESDLASALATKINGKADSATTLAGYGITDAYTKTQVDDAISNLNSNDTYEVQANKATDMTATFADDTKYPSAKAVKTALGLKADSTDLANMVTHTGAVGNATTPVYVDANGVVTAGTAWGTASTATLETTGVTANGTTVPTSGQVASYVSGAISDLNLGTTYATKSEVGDTTNLATTYGTGNNTVVKAVAAVKATADAAIPAPQDACTNLGAKCVLTVGNDGYAWEVVQRGADENSGSGNGT